MSKMLDHFCRALAEETGDRRNWRVSINELANRLGLDAERATALAAECERSGYIQRDQSQSTKPERSVNVPLHSVTLTTTGGYDISKPSPRRPPARSAPSKRLVSRERESG